MPISKDRHTNRGGHNYIDLTDQRYGKLLVVRDTGRRKSRRPIWLCLCDCGESVEILGKYLRNGDTKSCGCGTKGNAHNRDAIGEITNSYWNPIVKQAKLRGVPFEITREFGWKLYLKQCGLCALTGEPIEFSTNIRDQRGKQTASLDRIDCAKGYTRTNVQWIHKRVNIMKNVMNNVELLEWCEKISHWLTVHPENIKKTKGRSESKIFKRSTLGK